MRLGIKRLLKPSLLAAVALLACGAQAQIKVGQTSGLSGPVSASVNEINAGAKLYFDHINSEGGVAGQKIEFVSLDDKFQVPIAVENAKKLLADPNVVTLFLNRGTPHAQALMPLLEEGRTPLVAPSTGAMVLHQPVHPWIFNVRATYQQEAERVIRHLGLGGLEHVGVLYVDDSFGEDAAQGAMRVFKEAGKTPAIFAPIDRAKPDYAKVIPEIIAKRPLGLLIIGSPASVAGGVAALREAGSAVTVATLSNNAASGFVTALGRHAKGVIVSQVFPSERRLAVPLIAEAARLAKLAGLPQMTPAMIEGYAASKVLVEGLRRAAKERGGVVTRAGLKAALETFNRVDIGGLEVGYSPTDHTGLSFSDLSIIDADGNFRR